MPQAFGLDFGTTNSALAFARSDRTVGVANFGDGSTFRSILYFDEDDNSRASKLRVVAGPDAIQNYLNARTPGRKTRKNMELLRQIRYQALEPAKIDALIDLVDHDLGYRLYRAIEAAKCALSDTPTARFHFTEAAVNVEKAMKRNEFEDWIEPEVRQIADCVNRLLAKCNVSPKDVDAIFMTGGSSFVPAVRRIFEQKFPSVPNRAGQEFTSVAEGLALHALELAD